jgi:hypothetical protein
MKSKLIRILAALSLTALLAACTLPDNTPPTAAPTVAPLITVIPLPTQAPTEPAAPTAIPATALPTAEPPTLTPTLRNTPTLPPPATIVCSDAPVTRLSKNGYAYASKTTATSNNVRSSPGLGANVLGLLQPGKGVQILEGPLCVEGYVWWKVRLLPNGITGWTAEGKGDVYWLIPCNGPEGCGS